MAVGRGGIKYYATTILAWWHGIKYYATAVRPCMVAWHFILCILYWLGGTILLEGGGLRKQINVTGRQKLLMKRK